MVVGTKTEIDSQSRQNDRSVCRHQTSRSLVKQAGTHQGSIL